MVEIRTPEDIRLLQEDLRLSNTSFGKALGVSRQTIANLRTGSTAITEHMANSIKWLVSLYRIDPTNSALPDVLRRKV
jgi:transcriptional regulator with XRE-family HTH domain